MGYAYGLTYASPYVHYGKRSADAEAKPEADPYLVYSGLHHGYAGYGYGYAAYPYTTYHYGKREAEAEAKPYYYGGYGYGFPTTYHYGKRSAEAEPQYFYSGLHTPYLY